jgi:phosphoglycolate phosphatase-like HAD superfamily hydrolase
MIHLAMQRTGVDAVRQVLVVGDTPSDMRAGDNAGAGAVVGVTSGSHDAASLRREPHDQLCESVAELPALIERLDRLAPRAPGRRALKHFA